MSFISGESKGWRPRGGTKRLNRGRENDGTIARCDHVAHVGARKDRDPEDIEIGPALVGGDEILERERVPVLQVDCARRRQRLHSNLKVGR